MDSKTEAEVERLISELGLLSEEDVREYKSDPDRSASLPGFSPWIAHLAVGSLMNRDFSCGKKIDYKSYGSAERAAKAMNEKKDRVDYHELEPYPCAHCGGWHVGRLMLKAEIFRYLRDAAKGEPC
jgi:hypothetical protein